MVYCAKFMHLIRLVCLTVFHDQSNSNLCWTSDIIMSQRRVRGRLKCKMQHKKMMFIVANYCLKSYIYKTCILYIRSAARWQWDTNEQPCNFNDSLRFNFIMQSAMSSVFHHMTYVEMNDESLQLLHLQCRRMRCSNTTN